MFIHTKIIYIGTRIYTQINEELFIAEIFLMQKYTQNKKARPTAIIRG